jgi:hypothetical protein
MTRVRARVATWKGLVKRGRRPALSGAGQLAGASAVTFGLWQIWEPIAWVAGGAALLLVSFGYGGKP